MAFPTGSSTSGVYPPFLGSVDQTDRKPLQTLLQQALTCFEHHFRTSFPTYDETVIHKYSKDYEKGLRGAIEATGQNPDSPEAQKKFFESRFKACQVDPQDLDAMRQYIDKSTHFTTGGALTFHLLVGEIENLMRRLDTDPLSDATFSQFLDKVSQLRNLQTKLEKEGENTSQVKQTLEVIKQREDQLKRMRQDSATFPNSSLAPLFDQLSGVDFKSPGSKEEVLQMIATYKSMLAKEVGDPEAREIVGFMNSLEADLKEGVIKDQEELNKRTDVLLEKLFKVLGLKDGDAEQNAQQGAVAVIGLVRRMRSGQSIPEELSYVMSVKLNELRHSLSQALLDSNSTSVMQVLATAYEELRCFEICQEQLSLVERETCQTLFNVQEMRALYDQIVCDYCPFSAQFLPELARLARVGPLVRVREACLVYLYGNLHKDDYKQLMQVPGFRETMQHLLMAFQAQEKEERQAKFSQPATFSLYYLDMVAFEWKLACFLGCEAQLRTHWDELLISAPLSRATIVSLALFATRCQFTRLQAACDQFLQLLQVTPAEKKENKVIEVFYEAFEPAACHAALKKLLAVDPSIQRIIFTPSRLSKGSSSSSEQTVNVAGFRKMKSLAVIAKKGVGEPIAIANIENFLKVFLKRDGEGVTTVGFRCWIDERTAFISYESEKPPVSGHWQEVYVNFKMNAGKWEISLGKPTHNPAWDSSYQSARQVVLNSFKAAINQLIQKTGGHLDCKDVGDLWLRLKIVEQAVVLKKSDKASKKEVAEPDLDALIEAAFEELRASSRMDDAK
jgi:hypothetical protein